LADLLEHPDVADIFLPLIESLSIQVQCSFIRLKQSFMSDKSNREVDPSLNPSSYTMLFLSIDFGDGITVHIGIVILVHIHTTDSSLVPSKIQVIWRYLPTDLRFLTRLAFKRMKEHEPELKGTQLVVKIISATSGCSSKSAKVHGQWLLLRFLTKSSGLFDATNDLKDPS